MAATDKDYVQMKGCRCPYCDSYNLEGGEVEIAEEVSGVAWQASPGRRSPAESAESIGTTNTTWSATSRRRTETMNAKANTPPLVQAAFEAVRKHFPEVDLVVYSQDGRWLFMDADLDSPSFGKRVDVGLLEDAQVYVEKHFTLPIAFQYRLTCGEEL